VYAAEKSNSNRNSKKQFSNNSLTNEVHQGLLFAPRRVQTISLFFISEWGLRIAEFIDFQLVAFLNPVKCWILNSTESIPITIFFETKRYGEMWISESIDFQ
jgi:hypothetical protein